MDDTSGPKVLYIREKLFSALGKLHVTDVSGQMLYACASNWTWLGENWVLEHNGMRVASSRRKLLALQPTWHVDTPDGPLVLKRRLWSLRRRVAVHGGPYDGAELTGTLFDFSFTFTHAGRVLARASGKFPSLRDCHVIEVLEPDAELLTVILMANVMIARRVRAGAQADLVPGQNVGMSS